MFEKLRLKKKIKKYRRIIAAIEQKRVRSQGALVEAILTHTTPSDEDVDYFNRYTEEIERNRNEMHELEVQLSQITNKN